MNEDLTTTEKVLLGITNPDLEIEDFDFDESSSPEELSSIGRKIRRFDRHIHRKGKKIKLDAHGIKKEIGASKHRMQVLERVHTLDEKKQKELVKGSAQISDKVIYSTIAMSDIVGNHLIATDKGVSIGERNTSNGKYQFPFLLQSIELMYDANALNGTFDDDLPKEILNGELSIHNNSKVLIGNLPISSLASVNGYPVDKRFNVYELDNPKWFKENTDIQATLDLFGTLTTGYVKILFKGTEVRPY